MSIPYSTSILIPEGKKQTKSIWRNGIWNSKSKLGIDCGVISGESNLQGNQSGCQNMGTNQVADLAVKGCWLFQGSTSRYYSALAADCFWRMSFLRRACEDTNCRWVRRWIWLPSVTEIPRGEMDEYLIILILCVVCVHDSWWGRSIPFIKQGFCHQLVYTFLIHFSANQLNPYALNTSTPSWKKSQHFPRVLKDEERNPKESFNFTSTPRDPRN